jgi:DNA topoisomerase-1
MGAGADLCDGEVLTTAVDRGRRARWWRRRGTQRQGFWYEDPGGLRISDEEQTQRIRALAIPPAWTEVRICPNAGGKLQAVGLDKNGRLQYRYHPNFAAKKQLEKYGRIERFGERLPIIRRLSNEHLALDGFPRERVLALITRLLDSLHFRLGTERSVKAYRTYGATTLRNRHLAILPGGVLQFQFTAKHHIRQRRILVDPDLAHLMQELKSLGGAKLFEYADPIGGIKAVRPPDVNAYIKSSMGAEFSAKDFRTWAGTLQAAVMLADIGPAESERAVKRNAVKAVKKVAERLGNTPTVCRSCYIHPVVFERYAAGITLERFRPKAERIVHRHMPDYEPEELSLLTMLRTDSLESDRKVAAAIEETVEEVKAAITEIVEAA